MLWPLSAHWGIEPWGGGTPWAGWLSSEAACVSIFFLQKPLLFAFLSVVVIGLHWENCFTSHVCFCPNVLSFGVAQVAAHGRFVSVPSLLDGLGAIHPHRQPAAQAVMHRRQRWREALARRSPRPRVCVCVCARACVCLRMWPRVRGSVCVRAVCLPWSCLLVGRQAFCCEPLARRFQMHPSAPRVHTGERLETQSTPTGGLQSSQHLSARPTD